MNITLQQLLSSGVGITHHDQQDYKDGAVETHHAVLVVWVGGLVMFVDVVDFEGYW